MKIFFYFMIHNNLEDFSELLKRVYSSVHHYLVYVDAKNPVIFRELRTKLEEFENIDVAWAGWSQVDCEFLGVRRALNSEKQWDYFIFLSGAHMSLVPLSELCDQLASANKKSFLVRNEISKLSERLMRSIQKRSKWIAFEVGNKVQKIPLPLWLLGKTPRFYGSSWHILHRDFLAKALDALESGNYPKSLRYVKFPDELFWQNILPDEEYETGLAHGSGNKLYVDFQGKPNPKWLTMEDLEKIEQSGAFFARKVSRNSDPELIDLFQAKTIENEQIASRFEKIIKEA